MGMLSPERGGIPLKEKSLDSTLRIKENIPSGNDTFQEMLAFERIGEAEGPGASSKDGPSAVAKYTQLMLPSHGPLMIESRGSTVHICHTLLYEDVGFLRPSYKRKCGILLPLKLGARSPALVQDQWECLSYHPPVNRLCSKF